MNELQLIFFGFQQSFIIYLNCQLSNRAKTNDGRIKKYHQSVVYDVNDSQFRADDKMELIKAKNDKKRQIHSRQKRMTDPC